MVNRAIDVPKKVQMVWRLRIHLNIPTCLKIIKTWQLTNFSEKRCSKNKWHNSKTAMVTGVVKLYRLWSVWLVVRYVLISWGGADCNVMRGNCLPVNWRVRDSSKLHQETHHISVTLRPEFPGTFWSNLLPSNLPTGESLLNGVIYLEWFKIVSYSFK